MKRAILGALAGLLCACATATPRDVAPMPEPPEGRLEARDGLVCMPPELADWLWRAQERAARYREELVEVPACDVSWWAAGAACVACGLVGGTAVGVAK